MNETTPIATRIDSEIYMLLNREVSEYKTLSKIEKRRYSISGWDVGSQRRFIESALMVYLRDKAIDYDIFKTYLSIQEKYKELDVKKQEDLRKKTGFNPNSFAEFFESAVTMADEFVNRADSPLYKKFIYIK